MYNLENYNFGRNFRIARKSKGISIQELSNIIHKSDTTIYKYERDEVLPDITTVLEICNALDISIEELTNKENIEDNKKYSTNPFSAEELFLYYPSSINKDKLTEMRLRVKTENGVIKVYFYINETETLFYIGSMESCDEYAFINLKNYTAVNPRFEKVMIMVNMQYSSDDIKLGIIVGLRSTINTPSIKKCAILKNRIKEYEKEEIMKRTKITDEELNQIKNDKFWYPNIENTIGFKCL